MASVEAAPKVLVAFDATHYRDEDAHHPTYLLGAELTRGQPKLNPVTRECAAPRPLRLFI